MVIQDWRSWFIGSQKSVYWKYSWGSNHKQNAAWSYGCTVIHSKFVWSKFIRKLTNSLVWLGWHLSIKTRTKCLYLYKAEYASVAGITAGSKLIKHVMSSMVYSIHYCWLALRWRKICQLYPNQIMHLY